MEDFHFASDEFISNFSDDLKALSDERIQFVIVGVENKVPIMLTARPDLKERILSIEVGHFDETCLQEIIKMGAKELHFAISNDSITSLIISESDNKAYMTQNICRHLCVVENITEKCTIKYKINKMENVMLACRLVALKNKPLYDEIVDTIGSQSHGNSTYKAYLWILKILSKNRVGKMGITLNQILHGIQNLGNNQIPGGSVYACVPRLPKLSKQCEQVFKYNNKTLFVDYGL
ncbi:MAG: hypothetical protein VR69_13050 [Peptococcaceae bacterium BRH_c4b]|nr:MAG: hypothetical protein VR69_13050 [Peptococcaceae bacterium BRH_c4b]